MMLARLLFKHGRFSLFFGIGCVSLVAASWAQTVGGGLKESSAKLPQRIDPVPLTFSEQCLRPSQTVTLMAVGDVLLHDSLQRWAAIQPAGFFSMMQGLQDLLSAADVAVANLEGPAAAGVLSSGAAVPEPAVRYDALVYRGYPMFNYHPSIVADLKRLGIDVLQTANNHSLDRRSLGVDRTIETIQAQGLVWTGTRHSRSPYQPWYGIHSVDKGGRRYNLAYLACAYGTNGIADPKKQVLQCYEDKEIVLTTIRQLRADPLIHAIVVLPHWGQEYQPQPDAAQMRLAREMAQAGATAIIGTHPHVVQPIELIPTVEGRLVPVVYSLGNFVSHQLGLPRLSSLIYMLALTPDESGKLSAQRVAWIPLQMRTGASFSVDAIDRLPAAQVSATRQHLLKTYSEKNLHPAQLPLWAEHSCR